MRHNSYSAEYWRVVRTGVPRASGGRKNHAMIKVPFLLIILGTVALGGFQASRCLTTNFVAYPSLFFFSSYIWTMNLFANNGTFSANVAQSLQKAKGGIPFTQPISSLMTSWAGINCNWQLIYSYNVFKCKWNWIIWINKRSVIAKWIHPDSLKGDRIVSYLITNLEGFYNGEF